MKIYHIVFAFCLISFSAGAGPFDEDLMTPKALQTLSQWLGVEEDAILEDEQRCRRNLGSILVVDSRGTGWLTETGWRPEAEAGFYKWLGKAVESRLRETEKSESQDGGSRVRKTTFRMTFFSDGQRVSFFVSAKFQKDSDPQSVLRQFLRSRL